ncbi:DNA-(apurinic or apyrimidinic site) lyase [Hydrogenobaculum sp. Y04AAS1]|uniref:endonuclease III n=1 Tax=Hydrogenobaculum sp. (strain Y04AAS1) TaxID=380749 RepID=UPI00015BCD73|nr:DNA-(apurinic or apyrimidinic site) lyase [Hydrogenobaculum sp. Y04AAS1]HCT66141.1 endonuclease III [Hydrogenobaculum sp.]
MKKTDIPKVFKILKKDYEENHAPVVTLIAHTTKDPFRVLVCALLSTRTKDETTARVCERLFVKVKSIEDLYNIKEEELKELIYGVGFYNTKAKNLKELSKILVEKYSAKIPNTLEELLELPGVGLKVANLVLAEGFGIPAICVDVHVHRITNRWCLVKTKTPEQTEEALKNILPKKYWIDINRYLVSFGQRICKPIKPSCNICPIERFCGKCIDKKNRSKQQKDL